MAVAVAGDKVYVRRGDFCYLGVVKPSSEESGIIVLGGAVELRYMESQQRLVTQGVTEHDQYVYLGLTSVRWDAVTVLRSDYVLPEGPQNG